MKRTAAVCFFIIIATGALSAQSIKVDKPAPEEICVKGQQTSIWWTNTGKLPADVRISLRNIDSTTEVMPIAETAPNTSTFGPWVPPASLPDGVYVVRVKAKGLAVHGDSVPFKISVMPEIHITSPREGALWTVKTVVTITWTQIGLLPRLINIQLKNKATEKITMIAQGATNRGTYSFLVPPDLPPGDFTLDVFVALNFPWNTPVISGKRGVKVISRTSGVR